MLKITLAYYLKFYSIPRALDSCRLTALLQNFFLITTTKKKMKKAWFKQQKGENKEDLSNLMYCIH